MQMLNLTLSKYVIDVLLHRLEVIKETEYIRELFEERADLGELDLALLEESAVNYYDALSSGSRTVSITTQEDLEIVIDCLEGCTYFGTPTNSAKERQRKEAVVNFAQQLSDVTKLNITPALS